MAAALNLQNYLAHYTAAVLEQIASSIEDLTEDELHFRPDGPCNSIGFDAWHIPRTADNLIHFAFEREMPVWLQQGLNEAWDLP